MPFSEHVYCVAVAFKMTERGREKVSLMLRSLRHGERGVWPGVP